MNLFQECSDIDECLDLANACTPNSICINTIVSMSHKNQYFFSGIIQSVYVNVFNFFSLLRDHIDAVSARLDMLGIRQLDVSLGNRAPRSVSTPVTLTLTASFSGTATSPALYVYTIHTHCVLTRCHV